MTDENPQAAEVRRKRNSLDELGVMRKVAELLGEQAREAQERIVAWVVARLRDVPHYEPVADGGGQSAQQGFRPLGRIYATVGPNDNGTTPAA